MRDPARSLVIDLYVWLVYRLHALACPMTVPWEALQLQLGPEYRPHRDFRRRFPLETLAEALAAYPGSEGGRGRGRRRAAPVQGGGGAELVQVSR